MEEDLIHATDEFSHAVVSGSDVCGVWLCVWLVVWGVAVVPRQQIIVDILFPMDTVPTEGLTVKHIHTGR